MSKTRRRGFGVIAAAAVALLALGLPAAAAEDGGYERRSNILIAKDAAFTDENGVRSGSGTAADPYVISGWEVSRLEIRDTGVHVVIRDNKVNSQLVLNWIGPHVKVYDNQVFDLRVNQNVRRTGAATSGVIRDNVFGVVGQLRHFDGLFTRNVVDRAASMWDEVFAAFGGTQRAVNFDGWNGARFTRNKIKGGYVEVRLHGHHHGSGFGEHSHHHGEGYEGMDHSKRYHEVWFTQNAIDGGPGGVALIYTDTAHSANDRTAASEENPALNKPHVHYTRVHLNNNDLIGGLRVDIFNSSDNRHTGTTHGLLEIRKNSITLPRRDVQGFSYPIGMDIRDVVDVELRIVKNRITGPGNPETVPVIGSIGASSGMRFRNVDMAEIYLYGNSLSAMWTGVEASRFGPDVKWFVRNLKMKGVENRTQTDGTTSGP